MTKCGTTAKLSDHWPTVTLGGKETVNKPVSNEAAERASGSLERMVRRLQLSEEVCRELRYLLTARVVDQDWSRICTMLHKWMKYAPKDVRYSRPPNNQAEARRDNDV